MSIVAKLAEQKRRRELEEGFNSIEDQRHEQIRTIREIAKESLESYVLRHRSATFAEYAVNHVVVQLLGAKMIVDASLALTYAYSRTGLIVTEENYSLLSPRDRAAWEWVIAEYFQEHCG